MKLNPAQAAFSHLLLSGTFVHEASFEEIQEWYGIYIHPQLALVISIDRYPDLVVDKPMTWRKEIGQKLVDAVNKAISLPFVWVWVAEGVLALLLELPSEWSAERNLNEKTFEIAKSIQETSALHDVSVSIGIGTYYDKPEMLYHSFEEAKKSMIDRFFQGNQLIFQYKVLASQEEQFWDPQTDAERMEFLARVRIGDVEGSVTILKILLDRIAQQYKFNVDMFKSEVVDLIMSMSRLVLESGVNAITILSENAHFIQDLYQTIRYDKFVKKVCDYGRKLTEEIAKTHVIEVSPVIRNAIRYIKENLLRRISLEEVAQYCCLSKYHFSHLFKKEVGMSFVDFLNKIRIEKALQYLETTDLTVQQIANLVGFEDSNYFSRIFKKYMQHSPTEYRSARLC